MKEVLLIGNGINNITNGYNWKNLIKSLIKKFCNGEINYEEKPFPLLYEEILAYSLRKGTGDENELKTFICKEIAQIEQNKCHNLIHEVKAENILTTNYDYIIEKVIDGNITHTNAGRVDETKYSLMRRTKLENKICNVWHIHGEADNPNTVTLGYEQYAGYLQNMRAYVTQGIKYKNYDLSALNQSFDDDCIRTWVDFFFKQNVHIIGLTLDFVEIDLWWLLVYRNRALNRKPSSSGKTGKIQNKIYYYFPISTEINLQEKNKREILKSANIELRGIEFKEKNWNGYYDELFERYIK